MPRIKKEKKELGITDEFTSSVDGATTEELRNKIVVMQKDIEECRLFLSENEDIVAKQNILADIKSELKELEAPTKEAVTVLKNRTKYIINLLKDRGNL